MSSYITVTLLISFGYIAYKFSKFCALFAQLIFKTTYGGNAITFPALSTQPPLNMPAKYWHLETRHTN